LQVYVYVTLCHGSLQVSQNNWDNLYIYAWDAADNKIFGDWPGTLVEGNTVTFPKEYYKAEIKYILNNNAAIQTKNQTQILSDDFTFTLPADIPGSFIVCNCPDWGTYLYIFYDSESFSPLGSWPGATLKTHEVYTYKYYPIDDFVDRNFNFILNNNDGIQTKNLWTYDGDNWVKKDGCHYYTYDSSKHH
ncbi:MAG: starch-binding protein, partial [Candidatus Cryptobacteroides sp.]